MLRVVCRYAAQEDPVDQKESAVAEGKDTAARDDCQKHDHVEPVGKRLAPRQSVNGPPVRREVSDGRATRKLREDVRNARVGGRVDLKTGDAGPGAEGKFILTKPVRVKVICWLTKRRV